MEVTIDCGRIQSREDLHRSFAEALFFPSWYGHNLDALHDQLTSISAVISIQNWASAEARLGKYALSAKKVLLHATAENKALTLNFV